MTAVRKRVAISQSNYIPWKGYFDLIASVDEFILYDDVQYTKNDWRNRNQIKTPKGLQWLSIPVGKEISRRIRDVEIRNDAWRANHWRTLEMNYRRTAHFVDVAQWLEPLYHSRVSTNLSETNRMFIQAICDFLNIDTVISSSWDYRLSEGKTERLVDLCHQANAEEYVSGPSAKVYIDHKAFADAGIRLRWFDYGGYPEYPQLWGKFEHAVSILDLIFNCGPEAVKFLKHTKSQ